MANVLHRISRDYLVSVNTPDYDPAEWIINPDLSAVEGIPPSHWKITGDVVAPMTSEECAEAERCAVYANLDLAGAIRVKQSMVNAFRDQKMAAGWTYNGVNYDSNAQARQNMTGTMTLITTGYTLPANFTWRSMVNTNHPYNNASFTAFFQASCLWMEAVYQTGWYHKGQIASLTTLDDIYQYDFSAGWPPSP